MLRKLNRLLDRAVELAVAMLFMVMVLVGGLQVFCRFALNIPLAWSEEVQIFAHVWIVFLTVPIAYNRGSHIMMDLLLRRVPAWTQRSVTIAVDAMWLWLGISITLYTLRLVRVAVFQTSPALEIPMSYIYVGMVIGGAYLSWIALRKLVTHFRGDDGASLETVEAPL